MFTLERKGGMGGGRKRGAERGGREGQRLVTGVRSGWGRASRSAFRRRVCTCVRDHRRSLGWGIERCPSFLADSKTRPGWSTKEEEDSRASHKRVKIVSPVIIYYVLLYINQSAQLLSENNDGCHVVTTISHIKRVKWCFRKLFRSAFSRWMG